jgi:hypothetical protein
MEPVTFETPFRVGYQEILRLEETADVIYANSDESLWSLEILERHAAATHYNSFPRMYILK